MQTFQKAVANKDKVVLVDFYAECVISEPCFARSPVLMRAASWCGPCRQFAPTYEAASEAHPDITFGSVNTEEQQELSAAAGISSIPTLMAFRDGILAATCHNTMSVTAMIFATLIGATLFSLVFRGLGGDDVVRAFLDAIPGGKYGALFVVMLALVWISGEAEAA